MHYLIVDFALFVTLTFGFPLHRYSVVCIAESLSLFYLFLNILICMYLLGDDASISWGSLMRTEQLCGLIHNRTKGKVGTIKHV